MKIQYMSDLHLEMYKNYDYWSKTKIEPIGDILVLAGDIIKLSKTYLSDPFFKKLSNDFEQVFIIPGNHEYYDITDYSILGKDSLEIELFPNVKIYNNKHIKYKGVNFIFSTLWSEITKPYVHVIENGIMCYKHIKYIEQNEIKYITTKRINELHSRDKFFLVNTLADMRDSDDKDPTIVVTHHLPTIQCVHDEYKNSPIRFGFYSEQLDLIKNSKIDYWIYGHSHRNISDIEIEGTKLITNQCGYVHMFEQSGFDENKIIQL